MEKIVVNQDLFREFLQDYYTKEKIDKILEGKYDYLLEMDILKIVDEYNEKVAKGDILGAKECLDSKEVSAFWSGIVDLESLLRLICDCNRFLGYKEQFLQVVRAKQDLFAYDESKSICRDCDYSGLATYAELFETFERVEKFASSEAIYQLLAYVLKYKGIFKQISEAYFKLRCLGDASRAEQIRDVIHSESLEDEIGIIKIEDSKYEDKIVAGTKREMALSDVIGLPFPKDQDTPGQDVGYHGYYYIEPRKVVKIYHGEGITELHKKMIQEKKERIHKVESEPISDEMGYIWGCPISKHELIEHHIDPEKVGWKTVKPITFSRLVVTEGTLTLAQEAILESIDPEAIEHKIVSTYGLKDFLKQLRSFLTQGKEEKSKTLQKNR